MIFFSVINCDYQWSKYKINLIAMTAFHLNDLNMKCLPDRACHSWPSTGAAKPVCWSVIYYLKTSGTWVAWQRAQE